MTVQTLPLGAPLDYESFRDGARDLATRRRAAREQLERAVRDHADAECAYRKGRAQAYVIVDGKTVDEKKVNVDDRTAALASARDIAKGMIEVARELLSEIDAERASLHRLADWSLKLDPAAAEDRPATTSVIGGRRAA